MPEMKIKPRSIPVAFIDRLTISFICNSCIDKMLQEVCAILGDVYSFFSLSYQIMSNQIIKPFIEGAIFMGRREFVFCLIKYCLSLRQAQAL